MFNKITKHRNILRDIPVTRLQDATGSIFPLNNVSNAQIVGRSGNELVGYDYTTITSSAVTIAASTHGGELTDKYLSEIISIVSGSGSVSADEYLYASTIQFPAGALSYGVGAYVISNFQTSSNFALGLSASVGGFEEKWGLGVEGTAGINNTTSSLKSGQIYHVANQFIYVSASVLQGNAVTTGSMRVELRYKELIPPVR